VEEGALDIGRGIFWASNISGKMPNDQNVAKITNSLPDHGSAGGTRDITSSRSPPPISRRKAGARHPEKRQWGKAGAAGGGDVGGKALAFQYRGRFPGCGRKERKRFFLTHIKSSKRMGGRKGEKE